MWYARKETPPEVLIKKKRKLISVWVRNPASSPGSKRAENNYNQDLKRVRNEDTLPWFIRLRHKTGSAPPPNAALLSFFFLGYLICENAEHPGSDRPSLIKQAAWSRKQPRSSSLWKYAMMVLPSAIFYSQTLPMCQDGRDAAESRTELGFFFMSDFEHTQSCAYCHAQIHRKKRAPGELSGQDYCVRRHRR